MQRKSRKTVLILAFSNLEIDPRVRRQIDFLKEDYRVIAAGYQDPKLPNVSFIDIQPNAKNFASKLIGALRLLSGFFEDQYWKHPNTLAALRKLAIIPADIIIANDIETLPLALKIAKGTKVIFDAHEYAPREFEDNFIWKIFFQNYKTYLCRNYMPQAHATMTVAAGIAREYQQQFGVHPQVITNAPNLVKLDPTPAKSDTIRMVSHGLALPSRKLESMIEMFGYLDPRFSLDLILIPTDLSYLNKLKHLAKKYPAIRFPPPLTIQTIIRSLNSYDVGLFLLPPSNFNYTHTLPNKLFEFIQARLAVAIGPSPEMAAIVKKYQCGVVADDFSPKTLANALMQLNTSAIDSFKRNSHHTANELCAENNRNLFLNIIEKALKKP